MKMHEINRRGVKSMSRISRNSVLQNTIDNERNNNNSAQYDLNVLKITLRCVR